MEDKRLNQSGSSCKLLCCKSCISSEKICRSSSERGTTKKKPGGWKAMPFILGISVFLCVFFNFELIVSFFGDIIFEFIFHEQ